MASLLDYFGVLTLAGRGPLGKLQLRVPNLVIKRLYVERLQTLLLPDPADQEKGQQASEALYQYSEIPHSKDEDIMFAGIESGGTKWVCALGTGPDDIRAVERIPTTTPDETIGRAIEFFRRHSDPGAGIKAFGVGSFGPVELNPRATHYGHITTTPKPGWQFADLVGPLRRAFGAPVGFDTDVNAAALGEHRWGAAQGLDTFVYFTVGTGIGGGAMANGKLLHGMLHPEMGHMILPHDSARDPFAGACKFHGACLEGLASGPAMEQRWRARAETLLADHPAWALEAHYLALGVLNAISILSPQRVILGGGVMSQPHLFPLIRAEVKALLRDYLQVPQILETIDEYIVPPALGDRAGVLGAIALAELALDGSLANW
jgi:fructokinase